MNPATAPHRLIHCSGCDQVFRGTPLRAAQDHALDEHGIDEFERLIFTDVEVRLEVLAGDLSKMAGLLRLSSASGTIHRPDPHTLEVAGTGRNVWVARSRCNGTVVIASDNPADWSCMRCFGEEA